MAKDATKSKKLKNLSTDGPVRAKKRKASEDTPPVPVKKPKTLKAVKELPRKSLKKDPTSKSSIRANGAFTEENENTVSKKSNGVVENPPTTAAKSSNLKLPEPINEEEDVGQLADEEEEEEEEIDDQTEALLKGFESDSDDKNVDEEGGLQTGQVVPKIPTLDKKSLKAIKRLEGSETSDKPGVIYVGRIPHGFYENEMREYFEQFGKILKLRLSRNPKNGSSRHYAFIQFESASVADIVTKTMDSYLLFNHILKVKVVPDEQVHDDLFKGANKRFKKVPWNRIRGRELNQGVSEEVWEKRIGREVKRREIKAEKALKLFGYEFKSPEIKSAKGISKKLALDAVEQPKAIEAAPIVGEVSKPKKKDTSLQKMSGGTKN